jgi:hypothetical protein
MTLPHGAPATDATFISRQAMARDGLACQELLQIPEYPAPAAHGRPGCA